jgi:hypothetical protein
VGGISKTINGHLHAYIQGRNNIMKTDSITKIIEWLKANGKCEMQGGNYSFTCKDEPYMQFSAEWQDWDDHEQLFVGYQMVINGDLCNDPQFLFRIKDGSVTGVSYDNWTVGPRSLDEGEDLKYAFSFTEMTLKRHMLIRYDEAPHLAEAFNALCDKVQQKLSVSDEIIVPLEDGSEIRWNTVKLLDEVKKRIATATA